MAEKKYYWLKLSDKFFNDKAIKKLRKIAGGDTYTVIYLKMMLIAIKQNNRLYFDGIEDDFMEELALELGEDPENVAVTCTFLEKKGLLQVMTDEEFLLTQCAEMVGSETAAARRKRKSRANDAIANKIIDAYTENSDEKPTLEAANYTEAFEDFWAAYPRKGEKKGAYEKYKTRLKDGFDDATLLAAAFAYRDECLKNQTPQKFIKLGKTFLSDKLPFTDYIANKKQMMAPKTGTTESRATLDDPFGDWR